MLGNFIYPNFSSGGNITEKCNMVFKTSFEKKIFAPFISDWKHTAYRRTNSYCTLELCQAVP